MHNGRENQTKASRLRRLKGLAITATAALGMLLWGVVSGGVESAANARASSTPQPVGQDADDDADFFGSGIQDQAPGLSQADTKPMTRTRGS
jgi:hypothetical protein